MIKTASIIRGVIVTTANPINLSLRFQWYNPT